MPQFDASEPGCLFDPSDPDYLSMIPTEYLVRTLQERYSATIILLAKDTHARQEILFWRTSGPPTRVLGLTHCGVRLAQDDLYNAEEVEAEDVADQH